MKKELNRKENTKAGKILLLIIITLLFLLTLSLIWASRNFGSISMEEIVFTLNMPLEGSGSDLITGYLKSVVLTSIIFSLITGYLLFRKKKYMYSIVINKHKITLYPFFAKLWVYIVIIAIWTTSLFTFANNRFNVTDYIYNQINKSAFIEENYVKPDDVKITFPDKKRNLIYIFVESAESSLQDKTNGGLFDVNYIPEMTEIAKSNVSFSQSDKIEGAAVAPACGWTMAGMVAEFSGIPLKLYRYDDNATDNSMGNYRDFLPGIVNLGDILKREGYMNYYLLGSDVRFAGRDKYMKQHGDFSISDYYTAIKQGKIDEDYYVWWGYEDVKLYEYAKEELTDIASKGEPFNYTMLTVDTHGPDGYLCSECDNLYDHQYGNVWSCASRQLNEFVEWIKEQPFYEDTTIVICGDHCSMTPDFFTDYAYDKHHGEVTRKVYNAIINPAIDPVKEKNRKFVTMDMFPTTLAAMGAEIEGNRLALGTNLFSDEETLAEKFGYEYMFDELNRKSLYYNDEFLYSEK